MCHDLVVFIPSVKLAKTNKCNPPYHVFVFINFREKRRERKRERET